MKSPAIGCKKNNKKIVTQMEEQTPPQKPLKAALGAEDGQILIAQTEPKGLVSVTPKTKIDIVLKRSR